MCFFLLIRVWRPGRVLLQMPTSLLTLSLPQATIVAKLGYPLISSYSKRESLGNPRESQGIKGKCSIILRAIPTTHIEQLNRKVCFYIVWNVLSNKYGCVLTHIISSSLFVCGSTLTCGLISEQPSWLKMCFGSSNLHHSKYPWM